MTEYRSADICLLGSRGGVCFDCTSHVRLFYTFIVHIFFHKANAHMWWCRRIAIWNRNRIAMVIAMCAWSTNVAFLIHGKSISSLHHLFKDRDAHWLVLLYRCHTGTYSRPLALGFQGMVTHYLKLYATWLPAQSNCEILDTDKSNKNSIATLVSDVVLLLTMLVGLLRLRQDGIMLGMGQLLWKQVCKSSSRSHRSLIYFIERVWFGSSWQPSRRSPQRSVRFLPSS